MKKGNDTFWEAHLFVFLLNLAIPFVLFLNRRLDDNRLTSWNWVFDHDDLVSLGIVLFFVLVLAWILSFGTFYEQKRGLVLFGLSFILGSCFWSEPEVIVDSSRYFTQAKQLKLQGFDYFARQWGREIFAWTDLPVVPFLYGLVFKLFGEQRIFIQVLNTFFYSMTVVLTYQFGRSIWHEDLGFSAGLLLLGFPYLYTQVPLFLVDVSTMFFFMLAVVCCTNALQKGGTDRLALAGFVLFLAFYVKFSSWLLLTLIPVLFIYHLFIEPRRTIKRGGIIAIVGLVLIGFFFLLYRDILGPQLELLLKYQKPGLKSWSESYISTYFFQINPVITVAALLALGVAARKADSRFILIFFILLLYFVLQVKRVRYTLPIFPMVALMAAYGLEALRDRKLVKHLVLSIVAVSFVVAFTGFLPFLKSLGVQNLQAAGKYLDTIPASSIEVISFAGENVVLNPATAVPVLDIYTIKKLTAEQSSLSPEILERKQKSPLRFTWEFSLPEYYQPEAGGDTGIEALVIIADTPEPSLLQEVQHKISLYPHQKKFQRSLKIFQHQTYVTVYHK